VLDVLSGAVHWAVLFRFAGYGSEHALRRGAGIDAGSLKAIQKITKCTFWLVAIFQRIGQSLFCLAKFRRLKANSILFACIYS
jgi:hypothetical protein